MAYTNVQSGEIPEGTQYYSGKLPLGDYNFFLQFDATGVSPKIIAKCESPDGTMRTAASRTWPAGTQVTQWSVEANETEASVYVTVHEEGGKDPDANWDETPLYGSVHVLVADGSTYTRTQDYTPSNGAVMLIRCATTSGVYTYMASKTSGVVGQRVETRVTVATGEIYTTTTIRQTTSSYTYKGKTVYWGFLGGEPFSSSYISTTPSIPKGLPAPNGATVWNAVYGSSGPKDEEKLVARFAIDIGDAGGYPGGGGGWISPGDWNIDPTTTLHLTVNGALSGRHNDPIDDQSYSYVPADKATEKGYGSGGDGGNGGGGGAGASTVIVRQFATNKANSKEILDLAKRHGYGSGGGKGGKGGDGCILIYY